MTTIIVIVVVALVFFVAVCVVSFMIWKRESEMRTDSIRAIEENLEKLTYGLSSDSHEDDRNGFVSGGRKHGSGYAESAVAESASAKPRRSRNWDPFGWVRETDCSEPDQDDYRSRPDRTEEQRKKAENNDIEDIENAELPTGREETVSIEDGVTPEESEIRIAEEKGAAEPEQKPEQQIEENEKIEEIEKIEKKEPETDPDGEIDLDFIEKIVGNENSESASKGAIGYDVGRSGRKYTAAELETLIKE